MLSTLKTHFNTACRLRDRLTGKSRRMVERYLAQSRPHDDWMKNHFAERMALTIFDVGACECHDSIRYQKMFPNAAVHAFEANPRNFARAQNTLARYGHKEIILNAVALSDTIGELIFYCSEGAPEGKMNDEHWDYGNKSGSILEPDMEKINSAWNWLRFSKQEKVPCITLDEYCRNFSIDKIDLLHLDVQGAELMVLNGAIDMLGSIEAVWLEVSAERFHRGQAVASDLQVFFDSNGFHLAMRSGESPQWDELWCRC
jgi:FkbM family methyltransferase